MTFNEASASTTNVETYSSATANTGGNGGSGSIQTGNASASSTVENKINSENGNSSVKTEVKAEANGEKMEKKVEKEVNSGQPSAVSENTNANAESTIDNDNEALGLDPRVKPEDDNTTENYNLQTGFIDSIVTSVKNFIKSIFSIFS